MTSNPYATPESDPRREGRSAPEGRLRLAGFWIRFAGFLIDSLIVAVPLYATLFALIFNDPDMLDDRGEFRDQETAVLTYGITIAYTASYFIVFWATLAATPGKLMLGIYIVSARTREKIGWGQAIGRYFGSIVSNLICYIGYLIAAFTERRQALHDLIANTYVVHKD